MAPRTLVEYARAGDVASVRGLVEAGASPDAASERGERPLVVAVSEHRLEVVRALLELGADPNLADASGAPLDHALGHRAILHALLVAGADPTRANDLLFHAAPFPGALALLLEHGADPNATTANFETALSFACDEGRLASAELLLAAGANPNQLDPETGRTPLHFAAENGRLELVDRLLDAGADPTTRGPDAWTSLEAALVRGHVEAARVLVERAPQLGAMGALDVVALADDLGEEELARRLEALRWSEPAGGLRARLRVHQAPGTLEPSRLRRRLEVFVDFENVGERSVSIITDDPLSFEWHLAGSVEVSPTQHELRDQPAPVGRTEILTSPTWTRLAPRETTTRRVSHPPAAEDAFELDLVTCCWPTLGADERSVLSRHHLRATYHSSSRDREAPKDAWQGRLVCPARAIR